jgi:AraC-like DNA-binding protein
LQRCPYLRGQLPEEKPVALERHYSVAQVAEAWGVSRNTIRRIFKPLPGVLKFGRTKTRKQKYVTLSIPERIVKAQHALLTKGEN